MPQKLIERTHINCRSIIYFFNKSNTKEKKKIILSDFFSKVLILPREDQNIHLINLLRTLTPSAFNPMLNNFFDNVNNLTEEDSMGQDNNKSEQQHVKFPIDIGFVTIKPTELVAAKVALDIDPKKPHDYEHEGYRYWEAKLFSPVNGRDLDIILTMVGKPRNVQCANACRTLFNNFDVKLCVLTGMAAGPKGKTNLGDAVVADQVFDYEGARIEADGAMPRIESYRINSLLARNLSYFDPENSDWLSICLDKITKLRDYASIPSSETLEGWKPNFHQDVFLSGEKVIVDGSINERRKKIHEGTKALEMEGSGFASTCEECRIPWLIFKGISDFGDAESKNTVSETSGSRKEWQPVATLSAITAAIEFFRHEYKITDGMAF
jgi:nucleoside phosphorylase